MTTPFIRTNKGFSSAEAATFLEVVATSEETKGDKICKEITESNQEAKCESGTWTKFETTLQLQNFGKYLWIQNPKCYAEKKTEIVKNTPIRCEIVIYKSK